MYDQVADEVIRARLINWGLFGRFGGIPKLGYPAFIQIMQEYFPSDHPMLPDSIDAMRLDYIISTLNMAGKDDCGRGDLYQYILLMEYKERERPQSDKAKRVSQKFRCRCASSTYRAHHAKARKAVALFAEPLT